MRRPLSRIAKLFRNAKPPVRSAAPAPRFNVETLEDRVVPANFTITGANLSISLSVNEALTITDTAAGTTTFAITNGNFTQMGGDAPAGGGAGTPVIVVNDTQLATSLTINNAVAVANNNDSANSVTFTGNGTTDNVTSNLISVTIADPDLGTDVDNVSFAGLQLVNPVAGVTITTANGTMTSPGLGTDVTASTLVLGAPGGIGAVAAPIATTVANIEATSTGTGGVFIANTTSTARPDLTIGGILAGVTGISSGGPISVTVATGAAAAADLNVGEAVSAGGNVVLSADENVNINAAVSATGVASTIAITADANDNGTGDITSVAAGTVTSAGGAINIGGNLRTVNVTLGGAVTVNGGTGGITVSAESDVAINAPLAVAMSGTGGITVIGDNVNDGTGNVTTTAAISTQGGAISIGGIALTQTTTIGGAVTVNGGAGNITILAENGVNINAPVAVAMGGTGGIIVNADSDDAGLTGNFVSVAAGTVTTSGGTIVLFGTNATVGGNVTVNGGAGNLIVDSDNITTINAPLAVAMGGTGGITVGADSDNAMGGNIVTIAAGTLTTAGGAISIGGTAPNQAQDITLGGAVTVNGGTGGITVAAEGNALINAALSVAMAGTGGITVAADNDNSGMGNVTTTAAISTVGGAISLGGLAQDVTVGGNVTVTGGTGGITISGENNATINSPVAVAMGGTGGITVIADADNAAGGNINTTAAISTVGGNISIGPGGVAMGGAQDIAIGAGVTVSGGSGTILVAAEGTAVINGALAVDTAGTGGITVAADTDNSGVGNVTTTAAISTTGGAINIGTAAGTAIGGAVAQNVTLGGMVTVTGGTGVVTIRGENDVTVNAAVNVANTTGTIGIAANDDTAGNGVLATGAGGTLTTQGGDIGLAGNDVDLGAAVTTTATVAGTNDVFLFPIVAGSTIDLGTDPANPQMFGLTSTDLNRITTGIVRVGNPTGSAPVSGAITVSSQVNLTSTTTLALGTGANILDGTVGEQPDVTVTNLVLRTVTGVADLVEDLDTAVTNLALVNTTSGTVNVFNATAALNITTVDGVVGATQTNPAGLGSLFVTNVLGTGGDITVVENVTNAGATATAAVRLSAGGNLSVNANRTVQAGSAVNGGSINLDANFQNPTGTADITLATGAQVLTRGIVNVLADQNGTAAVGGGMVTMNTGTQIAGPGGTRANIVAIEGGEDVLVTTVLAAGNISARSAAALNDDSVETTLLDTTGGNISLSGGGRIGSAVALTPADIVTPGSANYLGLIDVAYPAAGMLNLSQVNTLGNVQVRKVGGTLNTGNIVPSTPLIGSGNQLTIVSTGPISVAGNFTLADGNLLFGTAEVQNNITFTAAGSITNNGPMSTSTLVAAGGAGSSIITTGPNDTTANFAGTNLVLSTTGGAVGSVAVPLEVDARMGSLSGNTTLGGATGGAFFATDTLNGLRVGQVNAGTTGDVTLNSLANLTPAGSNIVAAGAANDGVAEVIGNVITLTTTAAAATGAGAQIGTPTSFLELSAGTINATTNNSSAYIAEVGNGAQVGEVNTGTGPVAGLRVANGATLTSDADAVADVLAPTVELSTGTGGGNFGLSLTGTGTAGPLQINADTLNGTLNTGNAFVQDLDGGMNILGLTVQNLTTGSGNLGVATGGAGPITLGNASTTGNAAISTAGTTPATGTVTLQSGGSINAGGTNPVADVAGLVLNATTAAGGSIGSVGAELVTILGTAATPGTLSATTVLGSVAITNNSPGAALGLNNISGSGPVQIIGLGTAAAGENITVNAGQSVNSDLSNVTITAADNLTLNGAVTANSTVIQATAMLTAGGTLTSVAGGTVSASGIADLTATGAATIGGTVTGGTSAFVDGSSVAINAAVTANAGTAAVTAAAGSVTTSAAVSATGGAATLTATGGSVTNNAAVTATGAGGSASLTATGGAVNVNANVSGAMGTTITANDSAAVGEDVIVAAAAAITAGAGMAIGITAGDTLSILGTVTATGAGVITLAVDPSAADAGGTVNVSAANRLTSTAAVLVNGGSEADTFNLSLQTAAPLTVDGNNPLTFPGDALLLGTTGATGVAFMTTGVGAGTVTATNRGTLTYTEVENLATATVTISATGPATEAGTAGQFTVTRVGDTSTDLTVSYAVTGTATNGADYAGLTGTVTILAGQTSATIAVTPLPDSATEGDETVIVTLTAAPGYLLGGVVSASVTIVDNPPPPPAPVPAPPVYTGATIINGVLVLAGPNGSTAATFPVPAGASVLFTDITGDGRGDVILFLPGIGVVALSGANGVVVAFAADINGDRAPDLLIFNPITGAPRSFTDGRTGQMIPLGN